MKKTFALVVALAFATPAFAASPTVTAPATATVQQTQTNPIAGVKIAEVGASPLLTFTVTISDTTGTLYATGPSVTQPVISGRGTASVTIKGSLANVNAALTSLQDWPGGTASDMILIQVSDGTNNGQGSIAVTVTPDPNAYLTFPDVASALARSAQGWAAVQCQPQPQCDKAQVTKYLWNVIPLASGAAVVLPPGLASVTNKNGTAGLTAAETAALSSATALGTAIPAPTSP